MSLQTIPEQWRKAVCVVLRTADRRFISYTNDALRRFEASIPDAFPNELQEALHAHLESNACAGCPVTMSKPSGATWEFFFNFRNQKLYGKILLRPDAKSIVIFSAHTPLKPTLSCE